MEDRSLFNKVDMWVWFLILGLILVVLFNSTNFYPEELFKILAPILIVSLLAFLGIFAISKTKESVKEYYSNKTKNILNEINKLRKRQVRENLDSQIDIDMEIVDLRKSLKEFRINFFEKSIIFSIILFVLTILSTFINIGSYFKIPNVLVMTIFFVWGLFYFSKILQLIFITIRMN